MNRSGWQSFLNHDAVSVAKFAKWIDSILSLPKANRRNRSRHPDVALVCEVLEPVQLLSAVGTSGTGEYLNSDFDDGVFSEYLHIKSGAAAIIAGAFVNSGSEPLVVKLDLPEAVSNISFTQLDASGYRTGERHDTRISIGGATVGFKRSGTNYSDSSLIIVNSGVTQRVKPTFEFGISFDVNLTIEDGVLRTRLTDRNGKTFDTPQIQIGTADTFTYIVNPRDGRNPNPDYPGMDNLVVTSKMSPADIIEGLDEVHDTAQQLEAYSQLRELDSLVDNHEFKTTHYAVAQQSLSPNKEVTTSPFRLDDGTLQVTGTTQIGDRTAFEVQTLNGEGKPVVRARLESGGSMPGVRLTIRNPNGNWTERFARLQIHSNSQQTFTLAIDHETVKLIVQRTNVAFFVAPAIIELAWTGASIESVSLSAVGGYLPTRISNVEVNASEAVSLRRARLLDNMGANDFDAGQAAQADLDKINANISSDASPIAQFEARRSAVATRILQLEQAATDAIEEATPDSVIFAAQVSEVIRRLQVGLVPYDRAKIGIAKVPGTLAIAIDIESVDDTSRVEVATRIYQGSDTGFGKNIFYTNDVQHSGGGIFHLEVRPGYGPSVRDSWGYEVTVFDSTGIIIGRQIIGPQQSTATQEWPTVENGLLSPVPIQASLYVVTTEKNALTFFATTPFNEATVRLTSGGSLSTLTVDVSARTQIAIGKLAGSQLPGDYAIELLSPFGEILKSIPLKIVGTESSRKIIVADAYMMSEDKIEQMVDDRLDAAISLGLTTDELTRIELENGVFVSAAYDAVADAKIELNGQRLLINNLALSHHAFMLKAVVGGVFDDYPNLMKASYHRQTSGMLFNADPVAAVAAGRRAMPWMSDSQIRGSIFRTEQDIKARIRDDMTRYERIITPMLDTAELIYHLRLDGRLAEANDLVRRLDQNIRNQVPILQGLEKPTAEQLIATIHRVYASRDFQVHFVHFYEYVLNNQTRSQYDDEQFAARQAVLREERNRQRTQASANQTTQELAHVVGTVQGSALTTSEQRRLARAARLYTNVIETSNDPRAKAIRELSNVIIVHASTSVEPTSVLGTSTAGAVIVEEALRFGEELSAALTNAKGLRPLSEIVQQTNANGVTAEDAIVDEVTTSIAKAVVESMTTDPRISSAEQAEIDQLKAELVLIRDARDQLVKTRHELTTLMNRSFDEMQDGSLLYEMASILTGMKKGLFDLANATAVNVAEVLATFSAFPVLRFANAGAGNDYTSIALDAGEFTFTAFPAAIAASNQVGVYTTLIIMDVELIVSATLMYSERQVTVDFTSALLQLSSQIEWIEAHHMWSRYNRILEIIGYYD